MKNLSNEQIVDYLGEHLPYELMMLRHTAARLTGDTPQLDWNAFYEAFVVHARNLYKFLKNEDDVGASHFAAHFGSKADGFSYLAGFTEQVLHLGPSRPKAAVAKVQLDDVRAAYEWIENKFEQFLSSLTEEQFRLWTEPQLPRVSAISSEARVAMVLVGNQRLGRQATHTSSEISLTTSTPASAAGAPSDNRN